MRLLPSPLPQFYAGDARHITCPQARGEQDSSQHTSPFAMLLPAESSPIAKEKEALDSFAPQAAMPEPPPYSPSNASAGPCLKRVNNLYIKEKDTAVRGTWLVDPNLRIPPTLLPKVPEDQRMDNLHIESRDATVDVRFHLESETPTKSYLYVGSIDGRITVTIVSIGVHEIGVRLLTKRVPFRHLASTRGFTSP